VRSEKFNQPANAKTAGSYGGDGKWNLGGWSTYPSKDELAISTKRPTLTPWVANQNNKDK
jgi:hypothetical protein